MLTLLVGGARSGKSTLAVQMGRRFGGPVTFLATAQPFDDDLARRIDRHRDERPSGWTTVEEPIELGHAIRSAPTDHLLVVDCLTVWLANLFVHVMPAPEDPPQIDDMVRALAARREVAGVAPTVVVSNEVGMGIVPESPMGREYRDVLGRVNQSVAALADTTLLMVAGRAVRLDDPWALLP